MTDPCLLRLIDRDRDSCEFNAGREEYCEFKAGRDLCALKPRLLVEPSPNPMADPDRSKDLPLREDEALERLLVLCD